MIVEHINDELAGAEVDSVIFVRDYVQLHLYADFDVRLQPEGMAGPGPVFATRDIHISAITHPEVEDSGGHSFPKSDAGWRDALCELINARVQHASVTEGDEFRIEFDSGAIFRVSLRDEDRRGPEAVNIFGRGTWIL